MTDDEARYLRGCSLLMQGLWADGWPLYESRPTRLRTGVRALAYPEWRGESLAGKRILVWGEQGLGDEVMFARFIPRLRALGASQVVVGCNGLHVRAFRQLGADLVISHTAERVWVPDLDYWSLFGSLPLHLGVTPEALDGSPYLAAEPVERGGVGLVERGNPLNPVDKDRSLPPGLLQAAIPHGRILDPQGDTLDSLRQLVGLDLLITVDTSWAHMAGALGVPCWVLLPEHGLDWRWLKGRRDTPWYSSARLFRQATPGDWSHVVGEVRAALEHSPFKTTL